MNEFRQIEAGGGGGGGFGVLFQEAYLELPPVTRTYLTACVLVAVAVYVDFVSPMQLYFSPLLIWKHGQLWRLISSFFFFGSFGFNFVLNMLFTYRYCRRLEEDSFRTRTADFVVMFIFGFAAIIVLAYLFFDLLFLGQSFTIMVVYIWARRNPHVPMTLFGLVNFNAPYLPWALVAFSVLVGNAIQGDILGIMVGHTYFFLEDVYPRQQGGVRLIKAPAWLSYLLDDEDVVHLNVGRAVPPRAVDVDGAHNDGQVANHGAGVNNNNNGGGDDDDGIRQRHPADGDRADNL